MVYKQFWCLNIYTITIVSTYQNVYVHYYYIVLTYVYCIIIIPSTNLMLTICMYLIISTAIFPWNLIQLSVEIINKLLKSFNNKYP